ncbi:MAG: carbohydrate kinase [Candidatus Cryptobacteroides sp.]|nr:carbohydrate kinase [Bacteroidales bacterium]MDY3963598.1 carbohydrate kinase [Candidatus Cryptobacteroides sp.]
MKNVVGLGEALWDMLPAGRQIGGAPANFAYHAGQFGHRAYAVSAVGRDELGQELISKFEEAKLNMVIPQVDYPTGTVGITLNESGIPQYEIREDVAWDNIPVSEELLALAQDTSAVCFGSLAQRNIVSRRTIQRFLEAMPDNRQTFKIFDVNLRQNYYDREVIGTSLEYCNILKLNDEELPIIVQLLGVEGCGDEEKCRCLMKKYSLDILILTQGSRGSYVFTEDETSFIETPKVEVADTVGAGDAFTGAFVGSLLNGKSVREAHITAVRVSAYVCTQHGAMPEIPESFIQ